MRCSFVSRWLVPCVVLVVAAWFSTAGWAQKQPSSAPAARKSTTPKAQPRLAPPDTRAKAVTKTGKAATTSQQTVASIPDGSVLRDVISSRVLRVCTRTDVPPFAYFQGSRLVGLDVELARQLAAWLSIRYGTLLKIQWVVVRADERLSFLRQEVCDVAVATFSKNAARAKQVSFSHAYFQTNKTILARKKVGDSPIVGLVRGATAPQTAFRGASFAYFRTYSDLSYAMKRGLLDYLVADSPTAMFLLRQSGKKRYKVDRQLSQQEKYAVGLHRGHTFLLREINRALKQLRKQGRLALMTRRWTGTP